MTTNNELLAAILGLTEAIKGSQETPAPATKAAKGSTKGKGKKSSSSTTPKETSVNTLTKKTRLAFIETHDWAQPGTSVSALSKAVLDEGQPLASGWKVATFREAKHVGLTTSEFVAARKSGGVVVALKPASGKANTRRAKALSKKTVAELRVLAGKKDIAGRSKMNRADLEAALLAA